MKLQPGMFGREFSPTECMGLRCGQIRGEDFVHNGGWYNARGEKIGWGDLSFNDMVLLSSRLDHDDVFVILSESDSFWNFVEEIGVIGSMSEVEPTADNPGVEYVTAKAMYAITNEGVFLITDEPRDLPSGAFRMEQMDRTFLTTLMKEPS